MPHTLPECTAAAVTEILAGAGFIISRAPGPQGQRLPGGVYAADLSLAVQRVAVYFSPRHPSPGPCRRRGMDAAQCGLQTEMVIELTGEYLAVWTGREF